MRFGMAKKERTLRIVGFHPAPDVRDSLRESKSQGVTITFTCNAALREFFRLNRKPK